MLPILHIFFNSVSMCDSEGKRLLRCVSFVVVTHDRSSAIALENDGRYRCTLRYVHLRHLAVIGVGVRRVCRFVLEVGAKIGRVAYEFYALKNGSTTIYSKNAIR